jgi:exodeoxyribonuclease VII large subunit
MLKAERIVERKLDLLRARINRADAVFAGLPLRLAGEVGRSRERLASISRRGAAGLDTFLRRERQALVAHDRILQSLSYKNVLKRGYAVIRDEDDHVLSSATVVADGKPVSIEFSDGRVKAVAGEGDGTSPSARKKNLSKAPASSGASGQGTLF